MESFFISAQQALSSKGQIHFTIRNNNQTAQWDVEDQANAAGLVLKESIPFDSSLFVGYKKVAEASTTYKFEKGEVERKPKFSEPTKESLQPIKKLDGTVQCELCKLTFPTRKDFDLHKKDPEHISRVREANKFIIQQEQEEKAEEKRLKKEKYGIVYRCNFCNRNFGTLSKMNGHVNRFVERNWI